MEQFMLENIWLIVLLLIWTLPWKGYALWRAAQNKQMKWFIVILVINTFAVLEITYIFYFQASERNRKANFSISELTMSVPI